jgi:hypothetical protein
MLVGAMTYRWPLLPNPPHSLMDEDTPASVPIGKVHLDPKRLGGTKARSDGPGYRESPDLTNTGATSLLVTPRVRLPWLVNEKPGCEKLESGGSPGNEVALRMQDASVGRLFEPVESTRAPRVKYANSPKP